jgi:hypothetical protein
MLFFDNTSNNYVSWQWYKNGTLAFGATEPYYNESGALNGTYYVSATDANGNVMQTCPLTFSGSATVSGGIKAFPNPAKAGTAITVTCNYPAAALSGAQLLVTDVSGKVIQQITTVQPSMQFTAPSAGGMYVVTLLLNTGEKATVSILVN